VLHAIYPKYLPLPSGSSKLVTLEAAVVLVVIGATNVTARIEWSPTMTPADAKGVADISWTTNESTSARNIIVAFYPGVYRGVIYISIVKVVVESAKTS